MKDYKKYWLYGLLTMIMGLGLHSCQNDSYDVEGNPDVLLYFHNSWSPANMPRNSYLFNIKRTPIGGEGDNVLIKIPVRVTRTLNLDATVSAKVDNSLVENYNAKYKTNYQTFPEGSLNWVKGSVKIAAGSYESSDSLQFFVSKDQYEKFINTAYLLPVRLTDASIGEVSSTASVLWTFVNSEYKLIKDNVDASAMLGTLVTDYSSWAITSTDEPSLNYSTCLDNNQNTGVNFSRVERPTIIVDMKADCNLSGIRLLAYPYRWGNNYDLGSVKVEISSDNLTWTFAGITANTMSKDGYYQLISFYKGFKARYVRLNLKWLNGGNKNYRNLREIGVYVIKE